MWWGNKFISSLGPLEVLSCRGWVSGGLLWTCAFWGNSPQTCLRQGIELCWTSVSIPIKWFQLPIPPCEHIASFSWASWHSWNLSQILLLISILLSPISITLSINFIQWICTELLLVPDAGDSRMNMTQDWTSWGEGVGTWPCPGVGGEVIRNTFLEYGTPEPRVVLLQLL